ncbi:rhodanese-like domain-containing protein [Paenibacillus glycinis]|uniref:Rhodanese-like domain-containing protein n=1 Tax=Paenibacillus glycinis TaxID=2697035 RepID=A0ABW9XJ28_9BACL|nr:rhodanese-like domain-containing protein [Paenibacillus glycinis]NBD22620.1 rhodanese-like domain-containing protein [Paenibacillus glycinis]
MEPWSQIQPDAFWRLVQEGKLEPEQIIDVREQEEWNYYHLEGSTLMPLSSFQETWDRIPADKPVYIVCAHGVRSQAACRYLNEKGYSSLANVVGGMAAVSRHDGFQYD